MEGGCDHGFHLDEAALWAGHACTGEATLAARQHNRSWAPMPFGRAPTAIVGVRQRLDNERRGDEVENRIKSECAFYAWIIGLY